MPDASEPLEISVETYEQTVLNRLRPIERFAYFFCIGLAVLVGFLAISVAAKALISGGLSWKVLGDFLLAIGVSLVVAVAAAAVGVLLGFLFGIPRSLQRPASTVVGNRGPDGRMSPESANNSGPTRTFVSNTSFEEISDWLTKIIIGLGLVQFQLIIESLYKASEYAASYVASKPIPTDLSYDPALASPFFFALIVASLVAGCLFAYLETRTRLTLLFVGAELAKDDEADELLRAADRPIDQVSTKIERGTAGAVRAATELAPPTLEDEAIVKIPREAIQGTRQLLGWASAQARTSNFQVAEDALRDALQRDPNNDEIRLRIADVRRLRGNYSGALEMTMEVINRTTDERRKSDLLKRALFSALYIPMPVGFQQAIQLSDQLAEARAVDAQTYLWRACAFGQKYEWLLQRKSPDPAELTDARRNALECVEKVVELAPQYESSERFSLRMLFDPEVEGGSLEDGDLAVFKDDEDFRKIVYRGRP